MDPTLTVTVKCNTKKAFRQREAPFKGNAKKKIVYNACRYFKKQKTNPESFEHKTDANIVKLVAKATCVRESTVRRIITEGNKTFNNIGEAIFCDPKLAKTSAKLNINDYQLGVLRKIIYHIYTIEKVLPSLGIVADVLKQNGILNCGVETLRRLLFKIGYYFEKREKRSVLLERTDILEKRFDYLINMIKYRSINQNYIFFIGETKIDPVVYGDVGQGYGLNVMFVGNRNGLIADSVGVYKSNEDITPKIFHEWVENKLRHELPINSVVIMGSESYHFIEIIEISKIPTVGSLKQEMHEWLQARNICFTADMSKVELLKIINSNPSQKNYKVHNILEGHTVLHVPPFHADLNPMWLVLQDVKEALLRECVLTFEEKSMVLQRLFSEYPVDKIQKYDDIISCNEKEYWTYDMKMDGALDELLLGIKGSAHGADSSESNNEDEDIDSVASTEDNFE